MPYQTKVALAVVAGFVLLVALVVVVEAMRRGGNNNAQQAAAPAPAAPVTPRIIAPAPVPPPPPPRAVVTAAVPPPPPEPKVVAPLWAGLKPVRAPAPSEQETLTEKAILEAIQNGVNYLIAQFTGGRLNSGEENKSEEFQGENALAIQALLHASTAINDPRIAPGSELMTLLLDRLKSYDMSAQRIQTYRRSIRISALCHANRPQDRAVIEQDLQSLLKGCRDGGYSYGDTGGLPDNSNSQYGVLGIWAAAQAGFPVPESYWQDVEAYWTRMQHFTGGWTYMGSTQRPSTTMTAAGVTSLFLASQQPGTGKTTMGGMSQALVRGLEWMEEGDNAISRNQHVGYSYYGIERAGLASGYRFFGKHDWFRAIAPKILAGQQSDGSWPDGDGPICETSFMLLFLSRGSHPILMSKLRFDGTWNNRPNDVQRLVDYASPQLEKTFNWQIVPVGMDWRNWTGSPVLFMASDQQPELRGQDIENIRSFINHGGILFTHADNDSEAFNGYIAQLCETMYPQFPLSDLPEDHLLYSVFAKPAMKPALKYVSNGARVLIVHSPKELTGAWEKWTKKIRRGPPGMDTVLNAAVYSSGKAPFKTRLSSTYITPPSITPVGTIPVARVRYEGRWDVEPGAWENFARWMQLETSIDVAAKPVDISTMTPTDYPVAHLTGADTLELSSVDAQALRTYVSNGGILIVDPCGGSQAFLESVRPILEQEVMKDGSRRALTSDHPALTIGGYQIPPVEIRRAMGESSSAIVPPQVVEIGDGFVIFSERDLTIAMLGTSVWDMKSYSTDYARSIVRNALLQASLRAAPPAPAQQTSIVR